MKAGEGYEEKSVSPLETYDVGNISDADDEDGAIELEGEDAKRLALEKDGGEVRKLVDPLLPNKGSGPALGKGTFSIRKLV